VIIWIPHVALCSEFGFQKWMMVKGRIEIEYGGEMPHQVTRFDIENAIIRQIGSDKRTILKYLKLF